MKDVWALLFPLLTTIAKLLGPDGARGVVAGNLLMKQQLLVIKRARQRAPNLSVLDRFLFGFWTLFLNPRRILRAAVIIRPPTLLKFHAALQQGKYRLLYSSRQKGKPGPKGPSQELIQAMALCCMFNKAIAGMGVPKYLSSDNDPLLTYQCRIPSWNA